MLNTLFSLFCVDCGAELPPLEGTALDCPGCSRQYRALLGILDMRQFSPPYLSLETDWKHAQELCDHFDEMDFHSLVQFKYDRLYPHLDPAIRKKDVDDRVSRLALSRYRFQIVGDVANLAGYAFRSHGTALDIGCGTGPFTAVLAEHMDSIVGVDISLEELVLARKRLDEMGFQHVQLVACCAEKLPFGKDAFDFTHAMDVIEHVRDPKETIQEAYRVTRSDGFLSFNSPNRYDLLTPEPHVNIRFVGFLPRKLQEPYVRLLSGREYKGKRLLSLGELNRILEGCVSGLLGMEFRIFHWYLLDPRAGGHRFIGKAIRVVPGLTRLLNRAWGYLVNNHEIIVYTSEASLSPHIIPAEYGVERPAI